VPTNLPPLAPQGSPEFLFRGNAVAAGAFLTKLDGKAIAPDHKTVTTHGESSLPVIGGVSSSFIENPSLKFPQFISYNRCETFAEGYYDGDHTVTTARASVENVRLSTRPSPEDNLPEVQSTIFSASNFSLQIQSTYGPTAAEPQFKIVAAQPREMTLVARDKLGKDSPLSVTLDFDETFLACTSIQQLENEFLGTRSYFDEYISRFPALQKMVFGSSRIPRTSNGYLITSFVKQIRLGGEVIPGHTLARTGFGTIQFGLVMARPLNLRATMAYIKMACDPGGDASFGGSCTNGIWK
jgi:hypothetical protein